MQVVDHIPPHNFSAWPSRSSPRHPTESTPLLAGSSSNPLRSKAHSTRVGWNNAFQNRIRGKAHPTKHRKKPSPIRSLPSPEWLMDLESSHDHRHSNSGHLSPPPQRFSTPRSPSCVEIDAPDGIHPGPTDAKTPPTETVPPRSRSPSRSISLCLQNSGSVARDHLASERTFLSYVRTSLAIVSAGVALVQLFSAASQNRDTHRLHVYIRPLGATAIIIGLSVLFIGVTRYFMIQSALRKGYFPVARLATGFIALVLSVLVTLTFGILLAGKLEPKK